MKRSTHQMNRQVAVVFAVLCLIMTIVFSNTFFSNKPIDKTVAIEKTAVYNHYEEEYGWQTRRAYNSLNYIVLFFESSEKEYIHGECADKELREALEALKKNTELHMLINPNNNYIIELKANEKELLNFDYAQKQLRQEGIGFLCLAVFLLVLCSYFIYKAITTKEIITKEDIKFYWNILRRK